MIGSTDQVTQTKPRGTYQHPSRTIRDLLERSAHLYPNHIALQFGSEKMTYGQIRTDTQKMVYQMKDAGITADDIVVLLFQNTPACITGFLALAWLNIGFIPMEADTSITNVRSIFDEIPFTFVLGQGKKFVQLKQASNQTAQFAFVDIDALLAKPSTHIKVPDFEVPGASNAFVYHYTSGSTGNPKAALHSQENLVKGGLVYKETYQVSDQDNILITIPLLHSFGMVAGLITALASGAKLILCERFIPNFVLKTLTDERISILIAVPFVYELLTRCHMPSPPDLSSLRVCLSSGSALPLETTQQFQKKYQKAICQVYGSTETGVMCAQQSNMSDMARMSVGHPLHGVETRIIDQGQEVPTNQVGHLLVRTPSLFSGYFNQPEATAKVLKNGWYLTGDLVRQDEQGYIYIIGRKDTFINVGGKKVNPLEVEETLLADPAVREAVVFGHNAGSAGEAVHAAVVSNGNLKISKLLAFCRNQLAAYKVPVHIKICDHLPKTSLGKTRRAGL